MKLLDSRRLSILSQYIIGWTIAFIFLTIVRGEGTKELGSVEMEIGKAILVSFVFGPLFGSLSALGQILTEEYGYKRISFKKLLIFRFLFLLFFIGFMLIISFFIFSEKISFLAFIIEPGSFAIYFFIVCVDMLMFGLRQVNLFLGSNNFIDLILGKFYHPREEERIFMFLDLQSSTLHAENLGHITYSKMIQDCFNDLGVVVKNEAEIYQYVGDEVVLTWPLKKGIKKENCMNAFFNFKEELEKRKTHYLDHYQVLPIFKAGMHAGIVTVAEVGKYKKEIAYHGDTINTAARIQGQCNDFMQELIISEQLQQYVLDSNFIYSELGSIELKGKMNKTKLYGVNYTPK